jgi:hypothetical protein
VFLDTSVVNFILDYGEQIHENVVAPVNRSTRILRDIDALRNIWSTGQRTNWEIIISQYTVHELERTKDKSRRDSLLSWAGEIIDYQGGIDRVSSFGHAAPITIQEIVSVLPDSPDRKLVQDAIGAGCDAFCTRDWKTLLSFRDKLQLLPLKIIAPHEWWELIAPFAALWGIIFLLSIPYYAACAD